ncbi:MAG TPA: hypothetical protein VIW24_20860 [Aldersonia sp.]
MTRIRVEVVVAALCVVGGVACWVVGTPSTTFGPVDDGVAPFVSTTYSGTWLTTASVMVAAAGLLVVDVLVLRRRRDAVARVPEGGTLEP